MPMGLFGPRTGTNNAVSSGAHFGVRGRVLGSFLSLLTAISFYSISVWVSGDALVGAATRLFGDRKSTRLNSSHANISYAVFCLKKKKKLHYQLDDNYTPISARTTDR